MMSSLPVEAKKPEKRSQASRRDSFLNGRRPWHSLAGFWGVVALRGAINTGGLAINVAAIQLLGATGRVNGLTVENVVTFFYRRESSLERLLEQATNYHYSTFRLYSAGNFQSALAQFERNLRRRFGKDGHVSWHAENSLVIAREG